MTRRLMTSMRKGVRLGLLSVPALAIALVLLFRPASAPQLSFPDGKRFAFSIIDDTDMATLERLRPVYAVLERYGLRTTKTVWVMESNETSHSPNLGDSLRDPAYRRFIQDLQSKGFEIALHGVRGGSSRRQEMIAGLEEFRQILGAYPRMQINHSLNRENLYWGSHLYTLAPLRWAAALIVRHEFSGHDPASEYFWGDIAKQRVEYVRRFTYSETNLYRVAPSMPYRLDEMPYVNYWFPTANGDRVVDFEALLSDANLDLLEREGGVCLVYAHLGAGSFNRNGGADPRFESRIRAVASRNGWFVPASQILDFLRRQPGWTGTMTIKERARLDLKFVAQHFGVN